MAGIPSPKIPISFNQPDSMDLADELKLLRRLSYPLDMTKRLQNLNSLRAFAIEWDVKFLKFSPEDYLESIETFEETKGKILAKMRKELKSISQRDAENLRAVFSMGFGDLGSEGGEEPPET